MLNFFFWIVYFIFSRIMMPEMPILNGTLETEAFSKAYYADREAQGNLELTGNLTIILIILNSHWFLHFWEAAFLCIILRTSFKMNVHYSINLFFPGVHVYIYI